MMDLVQLKSFVEVAERGTVAAAAAAQGYTAPAVSQHLAKLEAGLGATLFDRVGGRVALTSAGRALLPIATEMLDLDARGRATVAEPDAIPHIVLAGFASAISTMVIPRLAALRRLATVEITEAEDRDGLRDLGLGAVDVVLTQEYDGAPADRNRRFTYTPLASDPLRLILPPGLPPTTTIDDLGTTPWLLNGRATRCAHATRAILARAGITPPIVGTVADNATLLALVAGGQGVTVVPARVLDDVRHDVTVSNEDLATARTILAVTRTPRTRAISQLLELLAGDPAGCDDQAIRDPLPPRPSVTASSSDLRRGRPPIDPPAAPTAPGDRAP
jgi:DNA-binding transcriptional LysR family regulator